MCVCVSLWVCVGVCVCVVVGVCGVSLVDWECHLAANEIILTQLAR